MSMKLNPHSSGLQVVTSVIAVGSSSAVGAVEAAVGTVTCDTACVSLVGRVRLSGLVGMAVELLVLKQIFQVLTPHRNRM